MRDKEKNFVSATVYVYNSEEEIERFGRMLIQTFEDNFEHSEIIFVNDHSTDHSAEIVKRLGGIASTTSLSLLNMSYFQGRETAMNAGLDMTIGDFVFEFDSTLIDYTEQVIMDIYTQALGGYDIVSASPDKNKRRTSGIFYRVFDKFSETPYRMCSERFRVLSRRVINRVTSMNNKIPYRKAVYSQCGLKTKNMIYSAMRPDKSKPYIMGRAEKRYRRNLGVDVLLLFTQLGYRFSIGMTATMILTTVLMIGYSFTIYLFGNPVEGWTTTILFFSFAFFGLFGLITIIIKYLQILVDLVFRRKQYYFESLEKLTK